jgi:hypothetical protein
MKGKKLFHRNIIMAVLLPLFVILSLSAIAQDKTQNDESKWGIHFSGFVKNDFWYDSRQVFTTREDLFLFYPLNEKLDAEGKDVNAGAVFNFNAMTTRLSANITTPDAMGAKISGLIEGDFSGVSNSYINGLRLRHAYVKLKWNHAELLIGQYWHPMFTTDAVPSVISLNTGAPFQPFIRNPQISLTGIFGNFRIMGAFITQRDNANDGPDGMTSQYMRNAIMPNAHLQFQYKSEHHAAGIGGDYKILKPRVLNYMNEVTTGRIGSWAMLAYYKFSAGKLCVKVKGIYGQNLTEHLLLGGYAVKSLDSVSGEYTYTPTNHLFTWLNITYGKKFQGGLFAGYAKNFGTSDENTGTYYTRAKDIAYMYRISPSFSYVAQKLQLSLEAEYTVAAYGTPDIKGIVKDTKEISNLRLLFTVFYNF